MANTTGKGNPSNAQLEHLQFKGSVWFENEWLPVTESTSDFMDAYWEGCRIINERIDRRAIEGATHAIFEAWKRGNNVFVFGNGGSAGNASHFAADLAKTTMVQGKPRIKSHCLNDNVSLLSAWTNDEGWASVYEGQLQNLFQPGDVAIALSVHGGSMGGNAGNWSQNLMRGLQHAKDNGGVAIGIAGFNGGAFPQVCDHSIIIPLDSTAHIEAYQMVVFHAIVFRLRQLMCQHEATPEPAIDKRHILKYLSEHLKE